MKSFSFIVGIILMLMSCYWMAKSDYGRANWFAIMAVSNFVLGLH